MKDCPDIGNPGHPDPPYRLPGQAPFFQVEPEASYWGFCPLLRTVQIWEVRAELAGSEPPFPLRESDEAQRELCELREQFERAHEPLDQKDLSEFLTDPIYVESPTPDPANPGMRIRCAPPGAVLNRRPRLDPIIATGAELASLFEAETPGLWHRQVFNVLLDSPVDRNDETSPLLREVLSPPRQALYWEALDTAISSALIAVWHYKWLATGLNQVAFRERPWEADNSLNVLYDFEVDYDEVGNIVRRRRREGPPQPSPGTPRHPAYGSGHSTYSSAASTVMACLLPDYGGEFKKLADNIGEARIWGGVHWRSDHTFGQLVGKAVGNLVIRQLQRSGIVKCPAGVDCPPPREQLQQAAQEFFERCGTGTDNFCIECDNKNVRMGAQG